MNSTLRLALTLSIAVLALAGCHRRSGHVQVAVATSGGGAITVSHRHYRNLLRIAARDMSCRHEQLVPQEVSPGVFSIQGCAQVRDYVMLCRGRHRCRWEAVQPVEQVAIAETRCGVGTIQLAITGPLSRQVLACGQTLDYSLVCGPAGCAWARGVAATGVLMQTEPGTSVIVVEDSSGQPPATYGTGGASEEIEQVGAAGTLQALFATQLAAVRACTGGQMVTVRVIWDAAGTVTIGLAGAQAGTPMEQCVQQAIGPVVLQGVTGAGEVQATL